jgi:succinate-acetate transporter protein
MFTDVIGCQGQFPGAWEGMGMAEVRTATAAPAIANPAALGLGAFALTTFILSAHNAMGATTTPLLAMFGYAVFYGGLAQFAAGMWEFKTGNTFGATAFTTYGAFWMGLATFVLLILWGKVAAKDVAPSLGWILLAFAIFNTYMLLWSTRLNMSVFLVFLTLEITEILLFIGNFNGNAAGTGLVALGGWMGIITALVAWYASAAVVANSMRPKPILPVGNPIWS